MAIKSELGAAPAHPACQTIVACVGVFDALVVEGNGGNDSITVGLIADDLPPLPGLLKGGDGDDTLKAPPDGRVGIAQPETVIDGAGGNDTIESGNGPDELYGGDGNDVMNSNRGADIVRGDGGDERFKRLRSAKVTLKTTTVGATSTPPSVSLKLKR